jgi:hypothetical protein
LRRLSPVLARVSGNGMRGRYGRRLCRGGLVIASPRMTRLPDIAGTDLGDGCLIAALANNGWLQCQSDRGLWRDGLVLTCPTASDWTRRAAGWGMCRGRGILVLSNKSGPFSHASRCLRHVGANVTHRRGCFGRDMRHLQVHLHSHSGPDTWHVRGNGSGLRHHTLYHHTGRDFRHARSIVGRDGANKPPGSGDRKPDRRIDRRSLRCRHRRRRGPDESQPLHPSIRRLHVRNRQRR